ncbi:MAG TPA: glycoside hydrolase family 3 N-terminal domain-containing protein [Candidatus Dormibacteraeota bacterium]
MRRMAAGAAILALAAACAQPSHAARPGPLASSSHPTPSADCAEQAVSRLDEPQRVGQLLWIGLRDNQLGPDEQAAIRDQHAGSVWFTVLSTAPAADVLAVAGAVQALAGPDTTGGVRFLVAANQEGGQIDQFHGPGFDPIPSASQQGQQDPALLRSDAATWGRQLRAAGVNLEVAPVMDTVPPGQDQANQPIGVLERGFGNDPATVTSHGVAFIQGMHDAGEPVTIKHFPGLGRVRGNTDFTAAVVDSQTTADDPYLQPFAAGIAAGADVVMISTATYTRIDSDHLAAFSPAVIRDLLRGRMGFQSVVAADDLGAAAAVAGIPAGQRAVDFVAAGGDLVDTKYASLAAPMAASILARAAQDPAFHARVDEATLHVLRLKQRYGLLPGCA